MGIKTFAALGLIGGAIGGKMFADYLTTNSIEPLMPYQIDALHKVYEVGYGVMGAIGGTTLGIVKRKLDSIKPTY